MIRPSPPAPLLGRHSRFSLSGRRCLLSAAPLARRQQPSCAGQRCWLPVLLAALLLGACAEPRFFEREDPRHLSDWNLFREEGSRLIPREQTLVFAPANPLFSDYAGKLRTMWLPDGKQARLRDDEIEFPAGSILSKTFYYPAEPGGILLDSAVDASELDRRRHRIIETRLLVRREQGWRALAYVWNEDQSEALLRVAGASVPASLRRESGVVDFVYFVPNENQCAGCHVTTHPGGPLRPLGAVPEQLAAAAIDHPAKGHPPPAKGHPPPSSSHSQGTPTPTIQPNQTRDTHPQINQGTPIPGSSQAAPETDQARDTHPQTGANPDNPNPTEGHPPSHATSEGHPPSQEANNPDAGHPSQPDTAETTPNTPNMERPSYSRAPGEGRAPYPGTQANDAANEGHPSYLRAMRERGWLGELPARQPAAISWEDSRAGLETRAQAYLNIHCGHCHNPGGAADTSALVLDGSHRGPTELGVCKTPVAAGGGAGDLWYSIHPGAPERSILLYRMESSELDEMMPELGRSLAHEEGIALIRDWIAAMAGDCPEPARALGND